MHYPENFNFYASPPVDGNGLSLVVTMWPQPMAAVGCTQGQDWEALYLGKNTIFLEHFVIEGVFGSFESAYFHLELHSWQYNVVGAT